MDPLIRSNLPEDCLIFKQIVPTLQEIAVFNVASPLCYNILCRITSDDKDELTTVFRTQVLEKEAEIYTKQFNVPHLIKDLIKKSFLKIKYEIIMWSYDTICELLFYLENDASLRRSHIKYLIWKPNGRIDYEKTARNILSHPDDFTQVEKFNLMCQFCWKDEIEALVPDVELQKFMVHFLTAPDRLPQFPEMYYWICKLENKLHEIPFPPNFSSLERFMLTLDLKSSASVEYFWNFIREDQMIVAFELLKEDEGMMSKQKSILSKLNEFQKSTVLSTIPHYIILNFMNSPNFEDARLVWTHVENSITDEEFVTLVKEVLRRISPGNIDNFSFMAEMWKTSSDQHKNYFVCRERNLIVDMFFGLLSPCCADSSLSFLSAVLRYSPPTYRRDMILEQWKTLFELNQNFAVVNKIIGVCLPTSDDVARFEKLVRESSIVEERLSQLFRGRAFDELISYFESYGFFESILNDCMKQFFDEYVLQYDYFMFEPSIWSKIKKLLKSVYVGDTLGIVRFKKKLLLSFQWDNVYLMTTENARHWKNAFEDLIEDMAVLDTIPFSVI